VEAFRSHLGIDIPLWVPGILLTVAVGLVLLGGIRRIAAVAESIVPTMIVIYLLAAIFYGDQFAASFPAIAAISVGTWVWILLIYSFGASVLPVWLLLQPRDYLNAHQLITGLVLLFLGLLVLQPVVQAPVVNPAPEGAPPMIPFLFVTIACGAISGFHGLVSSGTTSKQVACMTDARPIGYGGMLGEGTLGLLAVLAATAGFASQAEWFSHYESWGAASGLSAKLDAFVSGGAAFVASLGIPLETGRTFIAVDALGAGEGEFVLITQGSSARLTPETKGMPIDTVVVGIVDQVHVDHDCVYSRETRP